MRDVTHAHLQLGGGGGGLLWWLPLKCLAEFAAEVSGSHTDPMSYDLNVQVGLKSGGICMYTNMFIWTLYIHTYVFIYF